MTGRRDERGDDARPGHPPPKLPAPRVAGGAALQTLFEPEVARQSELTLGIRQIGPSFRRVDRASQHAGKELAVVDQSGRVLNAVAARQPVEHRRIGGVDAAHGGDAPQSALP